MLMVYGAALLAVACWLMIGAQGDHAARAELQGLADDYRYELDRVCLAGELAPPTCDAYRRTIDAYRAAPTRAQALELAAQAGAVDAPDLARVAAAILARMP